MNAYELADYFEYELKDVFPYCILTIRMLRQQADQIAELKNARDYWCLQYKDVINKLDNKF